MEIDYFFHAEFSALKNQSARNFNLMENGLKAAVAITDAMQGTSRDKIYQIYLEDGINV